MNRNETKQPLKSFPVAVIVSRFNEDITTKMKEDALAHLQSSGFSQSDIHCYDVPGAVEIPLVAQVLAKQGNVRAIITLGAVIRGETSHYDYVCTQVSQGCQQVMLDFELPVVFGILTTENEAQAWDRLGGAHGNKAVDAVNTALEMVELLASMA